MNKITEKLTKRRKLSIDYINKHDRAAEYIQRVIWKILDLLYDKKKLVPTQPIPVLGNDHISHLQNFTIPTDWMIDSYRPDIILRDFRHRICSSLIWLFQSTSTNLSKSIKVWASILKSWNRNWWNVPPHGSNINCSHRCSRNDSKTSWFLSSSVTRGSQKGKNSK